MAYYEIRIIKAGGAQSLVYACQHLTDASAIRAAQEIARGPGDHLEVWRGMDCIHLEENVAQTA